MKQAILKIALGIALLGAACASINTRSDGSIDVEITGLPEECDGDMSVIVVIKQQPATPGGKPVKLSENVVASNGKIHCVPAANEVADQDASTLLDGNRKITVELKIVDIDPMCALVLKGLLPGQPNIGNGSKGVSPPITPSSEGHWSTNVQSFNF